MQALGHASEVVGTEMNYSIDPDPKSLLPTDDHSVIVLGLCCPIW